MENFINSQGFLSSRSNMGADISYILAVTFTVLFLVSGLLAVKGKGMAHHKMIAVSMAAMLGYFFYYYKVRRLGFSSYVDNVHFEGTTWQYAKIFKPVLYVHFLTVSMSIYLAIYNMISGYGSAVASGPSLVLKNERTPLSKKLWGAGFVWLAFLAWWIFAAHGFSLGYAITFLFLGYFLPAGIALLIRGALPYSEKRHRVLGRLCIGLFGLLLVTSTVTYTMLYVL